MRLGIPSLLILLGTLLGPGSGAAQAGRLPGDSATGEIRGRVLGLRSGAAKPLLDVTLELTKGGLHRRVTTDIEGRYRASGLEPGRWRIQALHVGYEGMTMVVLVPGGSSVDVEMELTQRAIPLPPILVRGLPVTMGDPDRTEAEARDVGEVSLRALEGSPGMVESGLAHVVRSLPGNDSEAEPTDILLMRGSAADMKLVLLDGAPVYTPFHLGGLVDSFDPGVLGGASLFLGGAPARFDGGLSYILDLQTRSPARDRFRGAVAADLLTGRGRIEGPLAGGGIILSTRMIHDLGTPLLGRDDSPYGYQDLLLRSEWGSPGRVGGFITGFWNREDVRLDLQELAFADEATWGNQAVSGGLSGVMGGVQADIRGAVSRYEARLPVADSLPLFARSRSDRLRLTADLTWPWGAGSFRVGGSLDGLASNYLARGLDSVGAVVESGLDLVGTTRGVYAEGTRPVGSGVTIRGGLRLDQFSGGGGFRLAPRGSLTWLLTDNAALTVAAGRYHQFSALSSPEVEKVLSPAAGDSLNLSVGEELGVGAANHLVVSLDQILLPGLRLGLEGYMKSFSGVAGVGDERLNASGVDLRVARDGDRASGWIGYTLTWFWASNDGLLGGDPLFSGRHLLSAGLHTRLSENIGFQLRVSYGDGLPYTSVPIYAEPSSGLDMDSAGNRREEMQLDSDNVLNQAPGLAIGPDEGFLRVEGEIFGSWTIPMGGRESQLRPYLRILNALNRRDALFYHFDPWRNAGPKPLAEMPILPLVGLEWVF